MGSIKKWFGDPTANDRDFSLLTPEEEKMLVKIQWIVGTIVIAGLIAIILLIWK